VQPRGPLEGDEDVELLGLDQVGRRYDAGPVEVQWISLWKSEPGDPAGREGSPRARDSAKIVLCRL
jgi:hypothetical protein